MIKTIKENNYGFAVTITDEFIQEIPKQTQVLFSYEISGYGETEGKALEDFITNLDTLIDKLEGLQLK